jgi:hypothetical protein
LIGLKLYTNLEDSTTTGGSIERHYIWTDFRASNYSRFEDLTQTALLKVVLEVWTYHNPHKGNLTSLFVWDKSGGWASLVTLFMSFIVNLEMFTSKDIFDLAAVGYLIIGPSK